MCLEHNDNISSMSSLVNGQAAGYFLLRWSSFATKPLTLAQQREAATDSHSFTHSGLLLLQKDSWQRTRD